MFRTTCGPSGGGDADRQPLPDPDRQVELRVLGVEVWRRRACGVPVLPDQFQRLGAPLPLEVEGAFVRRRAAEVEHAEPALDRELQHVPVEQHVGAERVRFAQRRGPGHLDHRAVPVDDRRRPPAGRRDARRRSARCRRRCAALRRRTTWRRPACRGRACCGRTRRRSRPRARRRRVRPRAGSSRPCAPGSGPCDRAASHWRSGSAASGRRIATLWRLAARSGNSWPVWRSSRCAPPRASRLLDGAVDERPPRVGGVGDDAAVVEERHRHREASEQAAAEEHQRQHAGDALGRHRRPDTASRGRTRAR